MPGNAGRGRGRVAVHKILLNPFLKSTSVTVPHPETLAVKVTVSPVVYVAASLESVAVQAASAAAEFEIKKIIMAKARVLIF